MDEQTLRDNGVRRVVLMARDGDLDDDERQALLDALDAVPREKWAEAERFAQEGWSWVDDALRALGVKDVFGIKTERTRAERAEALAHIHREERDAECRVRQQAEADNARLREALERIVNARESRGDERDDECPHCGSQACWTVGTAGVLECIRTALPVIREAEDWRRLVRAALSDADADAEPERWWITTDFFRSGGEVVAGPVPTFDEAAAVRTEMERIQSPRTFFIDRDSEAKSRCGAPCDRCNTFCDRPEGHDGECDHCPCNEPSRAEGDKSPHVAPTCVWPCTRLAGHGGACNADAPDRAEGDDERSRAIEAATRAAKRLKRPDADLLAEEVIDAALASGGVKTVEEWQEACDGEWARMEERDRAEARVRELETAVRGLLGAIDDIDQAAWLLTMAVGNGDPGWLDTAVADVQKRHDLAYVGPSSPVSRARAALEGGDRG